MQSDNFYEISEDGMLVGLFLNMKKEKKNDEADSDLASAFRKEWLTIELMTRDIDESENNHVLHSEKYLIPQTIRVPEL